MDITSMDLSDSEEEKTNFIKGISERDKTPVVGASEFLLLDLTLDEAKLIKNRSYEVVCAPVVAIDKSLKTHALGVCTQEGELLASCVWSEPDPDFLTFYNRVNMNLYRFSKKNLPRLVFRRRDYHDERYIEELKKRVRSGDNVLDISSNSEVISILKSINDPSDTRVLDVLAKHLKRTMMKFIDFLYNPQAYTDEFKENRTTGPDYSSDDIFITADFWKNKHLYEPKLATQTQFNIYWDEHLIGNGYLGREKYLLKIKNRLFEFYRRLMECRSQCRLFNYTAVVNNLFVREEVLNPHPQRDLFVKDILRTVKKNVYQSSLYYTNTINNANLTPLQVNMTVYGKILNADLFKGYSVTECVSGGEFNSEIWYMFNRTCNKKKI